MISKIHETVYMQLALTQAVQGLGFTSPNPLVGCVIVQGTTIVGYGFHKKFGAAHAEVEALKKAGKRAQGATMYVTLEPCCHWGKTPPCTEAILKSGITRVVVAMQDPNPLVKGKGIRFLKKHRIKVETGLLREKARLLNDVYCNSFQDRRPYITLKMAQTLDGKIADTQGHSQWITNKKSRKYVHLLRGVHDAVLVGAGTVQQDNPRLTSRVRGVRNPFRIILDTNLRTPLTARVIKGNRDKRTILLAGMHVSARKIRLYERKGVAVWQVKRKGKLLNFKSVLQQAYQNDIKSIMIEGGQQVYASALKSGVVDKVVVFTAPKILGSGKPGIAEIGISRLDNALNLNKVTIRNWGDDVMVQGYLKAKRQGVCLPE